MTAGLAAVSGLASSGSFAELAQGNLGGGSPVGVPGTGFSFSGSSSATATAEATGGTINFGSQAGSSIGGGGPSQFLLIGVAVIAAIVLLRKR